jgi:hypothetical protein
MAMGDDSDGDGGDDGDGVPIRKVRTSATVVVMALTTEIVAEGRKGRKEGGRESSGERQTEMEEE